MRCEGPRCGHPGCKLDELAPPHARPSDQTMAVCALLSISERCWGQSREVSLLVADVRVGSKAVLTASKRDFRSTPNNGHHQTGAVADIVPFESSVIRQCRRVVVVLDGNSLGRDDTHFIRGVGHKKIIESIEPSLMVSGGNNRRHAVMNLFWTSRSAFPQAD